MFPFISQQVHRLHYTLPIPLWWWVLTMVPTLLYGAGVRIRIWLYQIRLRKSVYLPVPVISVGNLTTGGTGKTPTIIAIANYLHTQHGLNVGILNRGYGASDPQSYALATSPAFGDEAYMIQQACPHAKVVVGSKRKLTAQKLMNEYPIDVMLLDDGFQHVALGRDVNILLVDAQAQFGNDRLLPMGPLREPISALKRADMVMATRCSDAREGEALMERLICSQSAVKTQAASLIQRLSGLVPLVEKLELVASPSPALPLRERESAHKKKRVLPIESLQGQDVLIFSGIGNPAQFEKSIRDAGATVLEAVCLADHVALQGQALETLASRWEKRGKPIICCTDKDAVKLVPDPDRPFWQAIHIVQLETTLPSALCDLLERYVAAQGDLAKLSKTPSLEASSAHPEATR